MGWPRRARLFEVVAKTAEGEFLWHENTTSLLLRSEAEDAAAEAASASCRSCPRSPARIARQVRGTAKAGRFASPPPQRTERENRRHGAGSRQGTKQRMPGAECRAAEVQPGAGNARRRGVRAGVIIRILRFGGKYKPGFAKPCKTRFLCGILPVISPQGTTRPPRTYCRNTGPR